jgi:hypothetical protein
MQILYRIAKLWVIPERMNTPAVPRRVRMAPWYLMIAAITAAWFIKLAE